MKQKQKVYSYRGVWYNSDLEEASEHELEISECIILDDSIDIVSLYHSNFFEDMHGMTADEFIASPLYETINI